MAKRKLKYFFALAFITNALSNLLIAIEKIGGTEDSFKNLNNKEVIDGVANILVNGVEEAKHVPQSLSDLTTALKLGWKSEFITEENFPVLPEDEIEFSKKKFKLFNLRTPMSSQDALDEIEKNNYRPATLREMLQWAEVHWDRKDCVVALGQTWLDSVRFNRFSVLIFDGDECGLRADLFQYDWGLHYRFLAVHN